MVSLSVVIVAQDEERTIAQVLTAVKPICDEIILVDSGSTDGTVSIATDNGARVIHQKWLGYGPQKNFAIDQSTSDWVLSLDADEVVTPALADEIKARIHDHSDFQGFKIPRVLFIGDKPVRHGGFYPDAQLRLFRKGAGRFNDRLVHEAVRVEGNVGMLHNEMLHYAYADVNGFAAAMEKYARLSAQEFKRAGKSGWKASAINEFFHPIWTLIYRQIFRSGFMDGELGWQLNMIYSDYVRKKIRYLRELSDAAPGTESG